MSTPDPRRAPEPTMAGDDDLQAGQYGPDRKQGSAQVFPEGDATEPQPDDEQPPGVEPDEGG